LNDSALVLANPTEITAKAAPRVGVVYRLDQPGGVQSVVLSLIKGLNNRGIIPDVIWDTAPDQDLLEEKGVQAGFCPVNLPAPSFVMEMAPISARYILQAANVFTSQSIGKKYDFYYIFFNGFLVNDDTPHVRYLSGPPLLPQLEAVSPGLRGVPFRILRWMYHRLLRDKYPAYEYHRDSNYVINSEYTAGLFEQAHGVRLPVIPPPIDLSRYRFRDDDISTRETITYFSRFVDYKRPEMLLRLAEQYPQLRFVLMGGVKGEAREYYNKLVSQAAGLENVTLIDNPDTAEVSQELARTRFYVFPGVNEHFGMTTAEAISAGAVPYVHDSGGQREIVIDPRLRFTDEQFMQGFNALLQLSENELNEIRHVLSSHIQQYAEENFINRMLYFLDEAHQPSLMQLEPVQAANEEVK
jgi:glycosyltransferase involved in cell wall biosynthesis